MKATHSIIAAAALTFVQPTPASAAAGGPEVIIYRFPGVRDSGGAAGTGVATVFHCTNFSGATETIRLVTRGQVGDLLSNMSVDVPHLFTFSATTHTSLFYAANPLNTGFVAQGTTAIAATSINSICTAVTIDAANNPPSVAIPLHGIRFAPVPGSQE